ncbi:MAG: hypothetical protein ACYSU7_19445 [Planctomycetota bacterium]|jgi:hypothetical protein
MKRKLQFCTRGGLLIAAGAALGLTMLAQGGGPCTDPDAIITVEILTDNYGNETTWELVEQGVGLIASGGPYPNNTLITVDVDVCSTSCYDFTIFDSFGDGVCCVYGNGFYNAYYESNLVCSGGEFGASETCFDIACQGDPPCPWDCADPPDGVVGVVDFLALLAGWGGGGPCDFDGGGTGVTDFLIMLGEWGVCP